MGHRSRWGRNAHRRTWNVDGRAQRSPTSGWRTGSRSRRNDIDADAEHGPAGQADLGPGHRNPRGLHHRVAALCRTAKVATAGTPTVAGIARVGSTLTGYPGCGRRRRSSPIQWFADGAAIAGATKSRRSCPTTAQDGKAISVQVDRNEVRLRDGRQDLGSDSHGDALTAPRRSPAASASAIALTAKPNAWSTGTVFTYQWLANGAVISGATKSTFTLTVGSARQADHRQGDRQADRATPRSAQTSSSTARVATVATPTVSGVYAAGSTLTAKPNTWTTGTTFTYQWYADGVAISGATQLDARAQRGAARQADLCHRDGAQVRLRHHRAHVGEVGSRSR